LGSSSVVINEAGADVDFRVEGDTDSNLLFVDASTDRVGVGTNTPAVKFDVSGAISATGAITSGGTVQALSTVQSSSGADLTLNANGANRDVFLKVNGTTLLTAQGSTSNVGIGTTSPAAKLELESSAQDPSIFRIYNSYNSGASSFGIDFYRDSDSGSDKAVASVKALRTGGNDTSLIFGTSTTPDTVVERARITSGGALLVNATSTFAGDSILSAVGIRGIEVKNTGGSGQQTAIFWNNAASGDNLWVEFASETAVTIRGSITYNRGGGLVAYNTTSDYRAKDITGPIEDAGSTIDALKVYTGKMKDATVERPMLIAHEAQEVAPYAVTGEKDAVNEDGTPKYQQMDHSSLVPLLIAEIQSLRARVTALESK
jgi:hypothetical protein